MTKLSQKIKEDLKAAGLSVSADLDWKNQTQAELLSQLNIQDTSQPNQILLARHVFSSFFRDSVALLSKRAMATAIILLAVIVGPGLATVSAARASLPGDMLYPVKRKLENVQISLTFAPKNKAKVEMSLVANRLNELHRITMEQSHGDERDDNIDLALDELKKNTASVQTRLAAVTEENGVQDEDVVELAKDLEEKSIEYKQTLIDTVDSMDDTAAEDASADIEQALIVVQGVAIGALDILVQNHEDKGEEATEEDTEELNNRIKNQLDTTKEIIESLADRVDGDDSDDSQTEAGEASGEASEEEPVEDGDAEVADDTESAEDSASGESSTEEVATEDAGEGSEYDQEQLLLSVELLDHIQYANDLLELADFAEALDVLEETKIQVDELASNILNNTEDPAETDLVDNPVDSTDEPASEEAVTPDGITEETTETPENNPETPTEE